MNYANARGAELKNRRAEDTCTGLQFSFDGVGSHSVFHFDCKFHCCRFIQDLYCATQVQFRQVRSVPISAGRLQVSVESNIL
jgi:hypothetical protein